MSAPAGQMASRRMTVRRRHSDGAWLYGSGGGIGTLMRTTPPSIKNGTRQRGIAPSIFLLYYISR